MHATYLTKDECHLTAQTIVNVEGFLVVVFFLVSCVRAHDTARNNFGHCGGKNLDLI